MRIFVKTLTGQIISLEAGPGDSVESLKKQVQQREGSYSDQQRLVFNGRQLESERSLENCNLLNESVIHLSLRLREGVQYPTREERDYLWDVAKQLTYKMICRKCYAVNPPDAKTCRKRKCGHNPDLRKKKWCDEKKR